MGKLHINLLGTDFSVSSQEDTEYLDLLQDYYKAITQTFQKSGKVKDPLKISILSGIALVDELFKEKQKTAELLQQRETSEDTEAEEITNEIIDSIDKVL